MESCKPHEDGPDDGGDKYEVNELVDRVVVIGAVEGQLVD